MEDKQALELHELRKWDKSRFQAELGKAELHIEEPGKPNHTKTLTTNSRAPHPHPP